MNDRLIGMWYYTVYIPLKEKNFLHKVKHLLGRLYLKEYRYECYLNKNSEYTFFLSHTRDDYVMLFKKIMQTCNDKNILFLWKRKKRKFISFKTLIKELHMFNETKTVELVKWNANEEVIKYKVELDFYSRISLYLYYIEQKMNVDNIISTGVLQTENLVVLCDVWPLEALLVDVAKNNGVNTISCQHGIFIDDLNAESPDKYDYFEVKTDEYLSWGIQTNNLLLKYNPQIRITTCGNPVLKIKNCEKNKNYIAIMGDQPRFHKYTQEMIDIVMKVAEILNLKVKIRLHPQDLEGNYSINNDIAIFSRDTDDVYYVVGHTSTMITSSLMEGRHTYRYKTDVRYIEINDKLEFRNENELLQCIKKNESFNFAEEGMKKITYLEYESTKRYAEFFNKLVKENE